MANDGRFRASSFVVRRFKSCPVHSAHRFARAIVQGQATPQARSALAAILSCAPPRVGADVVPGQVCRCREAARNPRGCYQTALGSIPVLCTEKERGEFRGCAGQVCRRREAARNPRGCYQTALGSIPLLCTSSASTKTTILRFAREISGRPSGAAAVVCGAVGYSSDPRRCAGGAANPFERCKW